MSHYRHYSRKETLAYMKQVWKERLTYVGETLMFTGITIIALPFFILEKFVYRHEDNRKEIIE